MNGARPPGESWSALPAGGPARVVACRGGSKNLGVVRLHEFYRDTSAPRAHDVLPAAFAAVRNGAGELLLVRRIDDGNWELPGGRIEVGETVAEALVREVAEESGVTVVLTGLSGVYSDPTHVLVDPDGSVHQQLALCFHAVPAGPDGDGPDGDGGPRPDAVETDAASWCPVTGLDDLPMHPAMRLRVRHAVAVPHRPWWD